MPILVIIHFYSLKYTKRRALKFSNFELLEKLSGKKILSKNWTLLFMRFLVLMLLILSASGLIWWHNGYGANFDYAIAIDSSSSMMANDVQPTRLDGAKEAALEFVDALPGQARIGVVSFTGTTFIKQRLTESVKDVKSAIKDVAVESVGGTAIGDTMVTISNSIFEKNNGNIIILLTDGQSNVGVDSIGALDYLNEKSVMVYTIGIGSVQGGSFIEGSDALSKLDEETLMQIAEQTNGKYFKVNNLDEMKNAFRDVAAFRQKRIGTNLSVSFMLIALIGLLIEWGLMNSKYRSLP